MKDLLNKYSEANMFSLSERFSYLDRSTGEYSYYYLSDDECDNIIKSLELETYSRLKKMYDENPLSYDFDELFHDIKDECFLANDRFIADRNMRNETNYESNKSIWMMYHDINYMVQVKRTLLELAKRGQLYDECDLFETREYGLLCKYIKDTEIKFNNHCTVGPLFRTYYFELNDKTREWLLGRESVFNFRDGLEDLALYLDEKILYSSCTHEEDEVFYKPTTQKGNIDNLMALMGVSKKKETKEVKEPKETKEKKEKTNRKNNSKKTKKDGSTSKKGRKKR